MDRTRVLEPLPEDLTDEEHRAAKRDLAAIRKLVREMAPGWGETENINVTFPEWLQILGMDLDRYLLAIRAGLNQVQVIVQRNLRDANVNQALVRLFHVLGVNMDAQPVISPYGVAYYITQYVNKPAFNTSKFLRELNQQMRAAKDAEPVRKLVLKYGGAFLRGREIGAPECAMVLLGLPLLYSSRGTQFVSTARDERRTRCLKGDVELRALAAADPESTDVFMVGPVDIYRRYPELYNSMCLADFMCWYEPVRQRADTPREDSEGSTISTESSAMDTGRYI